MAQTGIQLVIIKYLVNHLFTHSFIHPYISVLTHSWFTRVWLEFMVCPMIVYFGLWFTIYGDNYIISTSDQTGFYGCELSVLVCASVSVSTLFNIMFCTMILGYNSIVCHQTATKSYKTCLFIYVWNHHRFLTITIKFFLKTNLVRNNFLNKLYLS